MKFIVIYSAVTTALVILLLVHAFRLQDRVSELSARLETLSVPSTDWETPDVPAVEPYAWKAKRLVIVNGQPRQYPEQSSEDGQETYYYGPKDKP